MKKLNLLLLKTKNLVKKLVEKSEIIDELKSNLSKQQKKIHL